MRKTVILTILFVAVVPASLVTALNMRHLSEVQKVDAEWQARTVTTLTDIDSVSSVRITPLVNWHAPTGLRSEPGVSYLVEADDQTILFDLGFNRAQTSPSPLEHNMEKLGIDVGQIDTVFISHAHRDHLGGTQYEKQRTFRLAATPTDLSGKQIFAPVALTHPRGKVTTVSVPQKLNNGVYSTGPIPRQLFMGRIDEQALVLNLEGKGLIILVGCGHQLIERLLAHVYETFDLPVFAIVGDLHYPVPEGRLRIAGLDAQRIFASGSGPFNPMTAADVDAFETLLKTQVQRVALGGHDTSDEVLNRLHASLGDKFQKAIVGQPIIFNGM